jgi:hypothetical protein
MVFKMTKKASNPKSPNAKKPSPPPAPPISGGKSLKEEDIVNFLNYLSKEALCPSKVRLPENEILCSGGKEDCCQRCWKDAIKSAKYLLG